MGPGAPGTQQGNSDPSQMMGDMMKNQQQQQQQQMQKRAGGMAGGPGGRGGVGAGMAGAGGGRPGLGPGGGGAAPGAGGLGPGAAGGGNQADDGPVNVNTPEGAVRGFLSALKGKNADKLSEATALRAARDSSAKNQEIFDKIIKVTISDSELDDLAKKLDGYQISGENPQTSTGKVDVIVQKSGNNGTYYKRKITVRREKKGWGVLDIGPEQPFKPLGNMGRRRTPAK